MAKLKEEKLDMEYVKEFISKTSPETAVYVGCDSKVAYRRRSGRKQRIAVYVTIIVVHYDQNRGAKLFKKVDILDDYGQMRTRLMQEVIFAGEVAMELVEAIGKRPFEIHLDVNPNPKEKSSVVVKEAVGYIMGLLGVNAKIKPDSIASSCAADKYAVKLAG